MTVATWHGNITDKFRVFHIQRAVSNTKPATITFVTCIFVSNKIGIVDCDILLNVENDKYNDALCKVITLMDMTDIYNDTLTGVYNRRYLNENLSRIIKALSRANSYLSYMMIDIDCFKKYNDHYGHIEGDRCLHQVAQALQSCVRRGDDIIVRYGGEEFAVVLPNSNMKGAKTVANLMLETIHSLSIPHKTSDVADIITVSIGIAVGIPSLNIDDYLFIKHADEMLYKSKHTGKNKYTLININNYIEC